jgi:hypothetical protein
VPERQLRQLGRDLVKRRVDKPVKLDFWHQTVSAHRQPNTGPDNSRLCQGSVHHPMGTKLSEKTIRHSEDPTQLSDVFSKEEHPLVFGHRLAKTLVEGFGH